MDLLAEELQETDEGFQITPEFILAVLLWVEGEENQTKILERVHQFAIKHKIKWGQEKCKVMRVGKHKGEKIDWKVGDMPIEETDRYKYLGDLITNDGKNLENLAVRRNNLRGITITINTIASSEVLNNIETSVLLMMHESKNISSLFNNAEAWILSKAEEAELEKIETRTIKDLFNLPLQTPTVAIFFTFGLLYTKQRLHKILLLYLHKLLTLGDYDHKKKAFKRIHSLNIGWAKNIVSILDMYQLPTDITDIEKKPPGEWKYMVLSKIEEKHKARLLEECYKMENGNQIPKTKTATLIPKLENPDYKRMQEPITKTMTKQQTRTLIIARYGMLACGRNYGGTIGKNCDLCQSYDDENHRLKTCTKWKDHNLLEKTDLSLNCTNVDFSQIYSEDEQIVKGLIPLIENLWNTKTGHGSMNLN